MWLGKKERNQTTLLTVCFAVLLAFAQFQLGSHIHDLNDDSSLVQECAICAVASHLDDADTPKAQFLRHSASKVAIKPQFKTVPAHVFVVNVSARAPPLS